MPKYKNVSTSMIAAWDYSFAPQQEIETKYFLNLDLFPGLRKVSDLPAIPKDFNLVLSDQSSSGNMSALRSFYSELLIKVTDGSSVPNVGSTADIYVYGSYTDNDADAVLVCLPVRFTKLNPKNSAGTTLSLWAPTPASGFSDSNLIENIKRDRFMFCAVSVKAISNGNINVWLKDIY